MNTQILEYLREVIKDEFNSGKISAFVGYRKVDGIPGKRRPFVCRTAEDADKLVYDSFCTQNLVRLIEGKSNFIKSLKQSKKKIGILVKGCDSKSIKVSISESKLDRHDFWILGISCSGNLDVSRMRDSLEVDSKEIVDDGKSIQLELLDGSKMKLEREDWLLPKCIHCSITKPDNFDLLIPDDDPRESKDGMDMEWVSEYKNKPFHVRQEFILKHLSRCVMCFACRDACPGCHCNENCVMNRQKLPEPFIHKSHELKDILQYHFIHFYHLSDRCTGCGECTRACPENIPLNIITDQLRLMQMENWEFAAGISEKATSPLSLIKGEEVLGG
ncbi:MAG: 4Fe-4S binding protein [Caldisericia bacterium]